MPRILNSTQIFLKYRNRIFRFWPELELEQNRLLGRRVPGISKGGKFLHKIYKSVRNLKMLLFLNGYKNKSVQENYEKAVLKIISVSIGLLYKMELSRKLINNFKCEICEKPFSTRQTIAKHINNVHGEVKIFVCNICNRIFESKTGLNFHIENYHQKGKQNWKCDS